MFWRIKFICTSNCKYVGALLKSYIISNSGDFSESIKSEESKESEDSYINKIYRIRF